MKRSPLNVGQRSLERGSTFTAEPKPLKRTAKPRPRRGVSPASDAQRRKVLRMGASIVSAQGPCDPAHLWPRGRGGCDDALCVVPLTRAEHAAYDLGQLDLLPHLLSRGLVAELQHALGHAGGDLIGLLHVLTGERFTPDTQHMTS